MSYWDDRPASVSNVRHYKREEGWRAHDDAKNEKGEITERGGSRLIEESLTAGLNAANLVLLTGAGSSFCAKNADGFARARHCLDGFWVWLQ
jgi:hypothetical protein